MDKKSFKASRVKNYNTIKICQRGIYLVYGYKFRPAVQQPVTT
jgi:hypothetical protein